MEPRRQRVRQLLLAVAGALGLMAASLTSLVALHVWLVRPPVNNDLGLLDGVLHGVMAPFAGVGFFVWGQAVKSFDSGWLYELGFHAAALAWLMLWQTLVQMRTFRRNGYRFAIERPLLGGQVMLLSGLALVGFAGGTSPWAAPSAVPWLFGVVPGALRHGAMAVLGGAVLLHTAVSVLSLGLAAPRS